MSIFFTNVAAAHKGFEIFRSNGNCRKRLYIISPVSPMFIHPMTRLKFLISSAQSPYNIQSIQYYSSITKLNLWSRSNYFFLFCLCPIFRQKNWYITHHNNLLHSRCLDSSAFGFVPQYSSWWKPYTGRKSVA